MIFTRTLNKAAPDIPNFYLVAEIKLTSFPGSNLYLTCLQNTVAAKGLIQHCERWSRMQFRDVDAATISGVVVELKISVTQNA